ncbi:immunoglobulin-like and fibronectin type III domain-containing protein 1 isoform X2 [Betta splendens]|uniref:immunoglobulin-like and fibronectin type III domain-containing protein 1 isoform X2 n=1 Tax=Betta splendens TaxID=158456 RepID=UPI00244E172A|nr:immunoglobulin-like and fibronectin type III domain-containing protein 1 isoform X2 [Betta splendens]
MWNRSRSTIPSTNRHCFSLVHQYIQHFNEVSGNKTATIRRRSITPGVVITQYVINIPEGKSTPDFRCRPMPMTIQEGKSAIFKAVVKGDPKPEVSWTRAKGNISDSQRFLSKYDESTGEHILKVCQVSADEVDIYKCYAVNEYGKAVCTASLSLTGAITYESDFRKLLRKSKVEKVDGETDERFWEAMLKADRTDYERICAEFGVRDLNLILKQLKEKKREIALNKTKNSVIQPEGENESISSKDLSEKDIRSSQLDAEVNLLLNEFKFSNVDFVVKIQEIKAQEREDALFECVLTHPLTRIKWMDWKGTILEDGDKYNISVSDHKLIHRLLIKDCKQENKGIYSAVAGTKSCSAWLVVEADSDPTSTDQKKLRKGAMAQSEQIDLEKVAREQKIKYQEEIMKILSAVKAKNEVGQLRKLKILTANDKLMAIDESEENLDAFKDLDPEKAGPTLKARHSQKDDAENSKKTEPRSAQMEASIVTRSNNASGAVEVSDCDDNEMSTGSVKHRRQNQRTHHLSAPQDVNEQASDCEGGYRDDGDDSTGQAHHPTCLKQSQLQLNGTLNKGKSKDHSEGDEAQHATGSAPHHRRKRQGPLIEEMVTDPGIQFICGLSDVSAIIDTSAELTCKLSSEDCSGVWFRDGRQIIHDDNFNITKDGAIHKLVIIKCKEEHTGKYRFEADGRKTEAMVFVQEPLTVKVGHNAIFRLHFVGHKPIKIQWYREGEQLQDNNNMKIETSAGHSRLLLMRCQRKDIGEIKIKLKNEHGFAEAISHLIVLDKPTPPLGPAEVINSCATCIDFKWRPPKDDGGSLVIKYMLERQQVGRNTWKKLKELPVVPSYRDTDVDHGRKYCYRIRAVTAEGQSEPMETDEMQAGTLAFPGPPTPPKVINASDTCISLCWAPPSNTGGSRILGYILEKRKKGSNLWSVVNAMDEPIKEKSYGVKDVVAGMEYEFRVTAINVSGIGEFSNPSEFVVARDPKKPPGKVTGLKVTETSYSHLVLTWTKPEEKPDLQDEAKGYLVEIRQSNCIEWTRCNSAPIITTSFSVKGLKSMNMYWVRVIAINDGGESEPKELTSYVVAMPSPVRPTFTSHKMKSFIVVKAEHSVRIQINFEALPQPDIIWLKDNSPVSKRVTISNSEGSSQLLIPCSERSDSGIYSILLKNVAGQETFSTEVRVTDDPKPPGPVELEENVPGTVTVTWEPSPDEKRDDRLHYLVSKLDSTKQTWTTVADRLFNNKFTACNIMHGREYHFRVYAKNDMGISAPSESPTWWTEKKKEKFIVNVKTREDCDLRCAPTFIVPLKLHTAPKGYECYMSCAVQGNPKPRVTWYRNNISVNTNSNYYISNTCGVCTMLILCVGPKDTGEYVVRAENGVGRAECSTVLSVID